MLVLVLMLTLSAGTLVSSTKAEPCPDTANLKCGEATYNPLSQICCKGVISQLANMTHPDCCAQKAYDRSTHLCCRHNTEAVLTDISKMGHPKCCGIKAFDVTREKCCSADVKDSMPIVYQPSSQSCKHEAKVDSLKPLVLYDMNTADCGCGVSYKPKSQMCCPGNVVVNIPANTTNAHCCGKTVYDQKTHKCCNDKTYDISGTVQPSCCGPKGTFYDQSTELCCDGEKKYFHGLASPACCGKEAFDAETHSCMDGKVGAKIKKEACPLQNTVYNTEKYNRRHTNSSEECDEKCIFDKDCHYWQRDDSKGYCYLMKESGKVKIQDRPGFVAGWKGCTGCARPLKKDQKLYDLPMVSGPSIKVKSIDECDQKCVENDECFFWTVNQDTCYLLKNNGDPSKSFKYKGNRSGWKGCTTK